MIGSQSLRVAAPFAPVMLLSAFANYAVAQSVSDVGTLDEESASRHFAAEAHYSPWAGRSYPTRPLFGDTHLHTALSFDAGMVGASLMPEDGYRFAKGEEVTSNTGLRVKLSRPLDFVVVADHSDNLGFAPDFFAGAPNILAVPKGKRWYDMVQEGRIGEAFSELLVDFGDGTFPEELKYQPGNPAFASAWELIIDAAEEANDPGRFTALIGYEWTSMPNGDNLHRNVIYRGDGDEAIQKLPYTTEEPLGSDDPRDLYQWMADYEEKTGGRLLAIAHNGNVSNGTMFPVIEPNTGREIDLAYAEARQRFEPLYEVTQSKGDSEAHPFLSPNDEFADYETWDFGNMGLTAAKEPEMLQYEYARSALRNGLMLGEKLGENPYQFGLVGSTDSHLGIPAIEEDNFFGKSAMSEPSADRWDHVFVENEAAGLRVMNWESMASGYAAVWATENTREAIFDAMQRRETYATTGSRMVVRFFGGWNFEAADAHNRAPARIGYRKGVPMGAVLTEAPDGAAPTFLVAALKDPIGANLDRIQIIKGWLDRRGNTHEKVYDVVWGDAESRRIGDDGKLGTVGSTVDVLNATWTNTIGDSELIAVWEDPDFDPSQHAFYYARVIEIPTPRWTAYDAKFYGVKMDDEVPMVTTERAYTSPIWYTP